MPCELMASDTTSQGIMKVGSDLVHQIQTGLGIEVENRQRGVLWYWTFFDVKHDSTISFNPLRAELF